MEGQSISVRIPLPYYKKKSKALFTMNTYRNAHQFQQANFKLAYTAICLSALAEIEHFFFQKVILEYTIYFPLTKNGNHKKIDLVNTLSVVDKVFADTLTSGGYIPDDYIAYIAKVIFKYNPTEEDDGYIIVEIKEDI